VKPQRLDRVLTCYRIGDPNGEYRIFDDAGAAIFSGRWHITEHPVVYASEHYSTAMLETLSHASGVMPPNQHFITITVPNGLSYEMVTKDQLPGWDNHDPDISREFGACWAREQRSALLLVPSYVARVERNILINLRHPQIKEISVSLPEPVWWDERLFG